MKGGAAASTYRQGEHPLISYLFYCLVTGAWRGSAGLSLSHRRPTLVAWLSSGLRCPGRRKGGERLKRHRMWRSGQAGIGCGASATPLESGTGDVSVLIENSELGKSFVVTTAPERALQVFHHPYAYNARARPPRSGAGDSHDEGRSHLILSN
jgi:hypothetical protein